MTNTKNKIALLSVAALSTIAIGMNTTIVKADELSTPNIYQKKLDNLKDKAKELNQKISDIETNKNSLENDIKNLPSEEVKEKLKQIEKDKKTITPVEIEKSKVSLKEISKEDDIKATNELKALLLEDQKSDLTDIEKKNKKSEEIKSLDSQIEEIKKQLKENEDEQAKANKSLEEAKEAEAKNIQESNTRITTASNHSVVHVGYDPVGDARSHVPVKIVDNKYPWGQCTWGAKEMAPWAGTYWGNGGDWAESARREGYKVGKTPVVGALIVWSGIYYGYGHVAVVTAVESETKIQVMESNYGTDGNGGPIGNYRGWFNPYNSGGEISYIYPPADYHA